MERKLAAIFSTDVKGYSRLMGNDEEATIRTLKTYRAVITTLIEQHHGRVVDSPGDNMLAEFASAVDAVQASVAIQKDLKTRNAELEDHRRMEFRIGLNVGDIITDEGRLYGDGVNIAARLEGLADAGGICISESVHTQVCNKLSLSYDYIGEREVKNIATPVPVYTVQLETGTVTTPSAPLSQAVRPSAKPQSFPLRWSFAALVVVAVLVGLAMIRWKPVSQVASVAQDSSPAGEAQNLPLPDKPSIAVLPFTNMSGDPEQEYFSDGMTETLITDLSKISGLFVFSRNAVFTYKGKAVRPKQVSHELGVRYVVEGSVQQAKERVRINVQLIDATTGGHVWAERYDRPRQDIFALQDEIVQQIVTGLRVEVREAEFARVRRVPTQNLTAYDAVLRGAEYFWLMTPEANTQARQLVKQAIELDPAYAEAYELLGFTYTNDFLFQWNQDPQNLDRAFELARQVLALDDTLSGAHRLMGWVYMLRDQQYEQAIAELEQAIVLDPNNDGSYAALADVLSFAGRPPRRPREGRASHAPQPTLSGLLLTGCILKTGLSGDAWVRSSKPHPSQ